MWGCQSRNTFPWEEAMEASVNIQLVRFTPDISTEKKLGSGMDHIVFALPKPPVIQVGYTAGFANAE
jgi:hypothetical protein